MSLPNIETLGHPRILVVGDLILDRYVFGNAERVSPEAPVLVLRVDSKEVRLGGAASTAMLLRGLEADVSLAGLVGDDSDGRTLASLLREERIDCQFVLIDPERPTTTKERVIGRAANRHAHQIVRIDHEVHERMSRADEERLSAGLLGLVPEFQAILISDYAKGACTPRLVSRLIGAARDAHVPVIVDPGRMDDYSYYAGATLIKPNRSEAELATGLTVRTIDQAMAAALKLRAQCGVNSVLVTLDRDGMVFAAPDGTAEHLRAIPREVYDITGAGDMVLAAFGLCLAGGIDLLEAAQIANVAAGLEIERLGVSPITRSDLSRALNAAGGDVEESSSIPSSTKLTTLPELLQLVDGYRRSGKAIVFTNGCFDLLHVGHLATLEQAAALGGILIVAVNSDASVRRLKGDGRPVVSQEDRTALLTALRCVDHVLVFDEPTPHRLLGAIRPDVLVKGGTTAEIVGCEVVKAYGGRVHRVSEVPGLSTTALLSRVRDSSQI